jgi:hypothetical protein
MHNLQTKQSRFNKCLFAFFFEYLHFKVFLGLHCLSWLNSLRTKILLMYNFKIFLVDQKFCLKIRNSASLIRNSTYINSFVFVIGALYQRFITVNKIGYGNGIRYADVTVKVTVVQRSCNKNCRYRKRLPFSACT